MGNGGGCVRAVGVVGIGQVARTEQEFAYNFVAHKFEMPLEQGDPFAAAARVVLFQPLVEATVLLLQLPDLPCVENSSLHFQAVADNAAVGQQPCHVVFAECGYGGNVKSCVGFAEGFAFVQHHRPVQPGLVDFQHQPFEECVVVG